MNSWKVWLIGIVLIIIIPVTVWLGVQVLAPKPNYEAMGKARAEFFEGYSYENRKAYDERGKEWKHEQAFHTFQNEQTKYSMFKMMICGPVALVMFMTSGLLNIPVISASLFVSGLVLTYMKTPACQSCPTMFGISFLLLALLFDFFGLLIVLRFAYRDSKE